VVSTRVGYAGGTSESPTYRKLGDHTETVQVQFDPDTITYTELLEVFWVNHAPWERRPVQYMSIIFFHNGAQEKAAIESIALQEKNSGRKIYTEVRPFEVFYLAEAYHQKYYLQRIDELKDEMQTVYPEVNDFVASTVAARINGYVAGLGTPEGLVKDLAGFGLSVQAEKKLVEMVSILHG